MIKGNSKNRAMKLIYFRHHYVKRDWKENISNFTFCRELQRGIEENELLTARPQERSLQSQLSNSQSDRDVSNNIHDMT